MHYPCFAHRFIMPNSKVIRIQDKQQLSELSPAQKKFNDLIQKIDVHKKRLAAWQETMPLCQQEIAGKLIPLRETFGTHQAELVAVLDGLYMTHKFTCGQQDKISYLITELCEELISQHGRDDLKPLYNRYSGWDFDAAKQEDDELARDALNSMFTHEFGVELDEDEFDFADPAGTSARLAEKLQEQQRYAEESSLKRKKTAKQLAKEVCEQEEASNVSKSIQAVYRQLVAALHPDREPDLVEKGRKTELMKKVTVAYGKKDLLQLLELQLSVEQIDQGKINNIAEDRLKYYNKILQTQLHGIQEEVMLTEMKVKNMAGLAPDAQLTPKQLLALMKQDILVLRGQISRIQHDVRRFNDVKQFKLWLKDFRIPEPGFDGFY